MSRFVRPESSVLHISQGDTLTVRARLNVGEQRAMFARMYAVDADDKRRVDLLQVGLSRVLAYLIDWSLVDDQGRHVEIRDQPADVIEAALNALDPDDFREIREAIDAHVEAQDAARQAEKKSPSGDLASSATSTSPAVAVGAMSG